ncbi:MAG TPA: TonB family protein [Ginsengibacter sp.]
MRLLLVSFSLFISISGFAQKILGSVMADENGVTNNQKKAKFLIVEKQINDSSFERLDYNFAGPMIATSTFRDKNLKILNGDYAGYHPNGYLATTGNYINNKKDGLWYAYNDTAKAITKYTFHLDSLLSTIDLDSLAKENKKIKEDTTGEVEAVYKGGNGKLRAIITSNFKVPDRTTSINKGGTVNIRFIIDTTGKPTNIEVLHSVEFAFDEEAMRVISYMNKWIPASDKGKKVNAYRIQPITISF